jgi:hypothetical protein
MKKVAIITIHAIKNYGSALQALATQELVKKLGFDPVIIDYAYPNPMHQQQPSLKGRVLRACNLCLMHLLAVRAKFKLREERYDQFIRNRMKLTRHYPSHDELMEAPPVADMYISGSDQIWHPRCIDYDTSFLLDFVPSEKPKVAFASSCGVDKFSDEQLALFRRYLSSYDSIAVRESAVQKMIHDILGEEPEEVLDPTLLLGRDEWQSIESPVDLKEPYILLYGNQEGQGSQMDVVARELQKSTGLQIIRIHGRPYHRFSRKIKYLFNVGPSEFIWLFRNASYVLANSFHGTVFSILFDRQFLSFYPASSDSGTRQLNLLKLLELDDRGLVLPMEIEVEQVARLMQEPIPFETCQDKLADMKEASIGWLSQALNAASGKN